MLRGDVIGIGTQSLAC